MTDIERYGVARWSPPPDHRPMPIVPPPRAPLTDCPTCGQRGDHRTIWQCISALSSPAQRFKFHGGTR